MYTDPELRERLEARILAGDDGGRPGKWSARKAQLLAARYERMGGGYLGPKSEAQKHLERWTRERWRTADRKKARRGKTTSRDLRRRH